MTRVLKPGGRMAIYDDPFSVYLCAKLMRQNGLELEKKAIVPAEIYGLGFWF